MANVNQRMQTARELDARLRELVALGNRVDAEVAFALAEMKERGLFRVLGYSRITDYADWELEVPKAKARALIEITKRLPELPQITDAFVSGRVPWTKTRLIVRVATVDTEEHWLHEAEVLSVRGLESAVAREKGEPPRVRITLDLTPQEAADLDAAVRHLREERGEAVSMGSAVVEMARRGLGRPVDGPRHQVVIHECPTCERATRVAHHGEVDVSQRELAAAKVDAAILDLRKGKTGEFTHTITPAERRAVIARDRDRCALCGVLQWLHIHHVVRRDGDPGVLSLLCSQCHGRVVHGGHVVVSGSAPAFEFRLVDGSPARVRGAAR
jgi:hypothetical protein